MKPADTEAVEQQLPSVDPARVADRIRAFDWSATALGPEPTWPAPLRSALAIAFAAPTPIVILWGRDGLMFPNDAFVAFAGGAFASQLGSSVVDTCPEMAEFHRGVMEAGLTGIVAFRDQHLVIAPDGVPTDAWIDFNYCPILDEQGRTAGVLATIVDTTARVIAQRQLGELNRAVAGAGADAPRPPDAGASALPAEQERALLISREREARREAELQRQHLFSLFMQAPMPVAVLRGPEYLIELANEPTCQIWERRHDDVIGRPLFEVLPEVRDQGFRELLDDVSRTGVPFVGNEMPARFARSNGTTDEFYFNFVFTPYRNARGDIEGVLITATDVTPQVAARQTMQRAQDRLTFALDAANVGYWDLDLVTHAAMRSLSHDRMFGYRALLPEWTFETFVEHVHPEDRASVVESFRRAAATGTDWQFECRIVRADGTPGWIAAHGRREVSADGTPLRMLGVVLDITERRELLERAREAQADADRASRAKDEFLAMLGHELRNPLAPIQTALHLMHLRGDASAERERTVIQRQVTHLTRLVDDLLDVSRIARGKVELRQECVEIAEVVAKAIETASPLLEQRAHSLEVDVPRSGLTVNGDPTRLAQVVSNLLTNAAKYTDAGGHITVRAGHDGDLVVLRVRDTGVGIGPELLPVVFDLFVQGGQALDRSHGGLGLGLTIVRSLVTLHGGTVAVHSDGPGRGSEFVVRLPAARREMAETRAPLTETGAGAPVPDALRVLVVDDNEDAAEMLVAALTLQGHDARAVHDGPAAIRLSETFRPAVALLDIGLPVMDGYELAERLRNLEGLRPLRLVALTGYGQEADRQRSRAAGFHHHLVKPIDFAQLEAVLRADRATAD